MIGLFIKIPFHAQLRRADPPLAAELSRIVAETATVFGARSLATEESFFLAFDEDSGCCRLRAAETARNLAGRLAPLSPRLHGHAIIIGAGSEEAEELHKTLKRRWYRTDKDGAFLDDSAASRFAGYIEAEGGGEAAPILGFPYAAAALPSGYEPPSLEAAVLDRFVDELGRHGSGESGGDILLAIGPGGTPRGYLEAALALLFGKSKAAFLAIRATATWSAPFGPFLEAFSTRPGPAALALLSGPEREALEELEPVAAFLAASPFRLGYSGAIRTRLKLYAAARLRLYARERREEGLPAIVILEGLDRFPTESLALVVELFGESPAAEGLVALGTAAARPAGLAGLRQRLLSAPPPSPAAIAEASRRGAAAVIDAAAEIGAKAEAEDEAGGARAARELLAAELEIAAEGDPFRLILALALEKRGKFPSRRISTDRLAEAALALYPPEYAEMLVAVGLSEEVLDAERLDEFLSAAGFVAGIRPLLFGGLSDLGLASAEGRPRLLRPEAASAGLVAPDGGAAIRTVFVERLLALHAARRIYPSAALYRNILRLGAGKKDPGLRFLFDCIAADALYGPSEPSETPRLGGPIDGLGPFLEAYAGGDEEAAAYRLDALETQAGAAEERAPEPLALALADVARASDDYGRGKPQAAAARAKPALIKLHGLGTARAEARAHRLLGLCALAQSQIQEGADYLVNAYEIAESLPDPFECFHAAFAEAGALLVLGDLRRAAQRGRLAAEWAARAFRADWESACDFLAGRIDFELGRYESAAGNFGRISAASRVYDESAAACRAEIWTARALAYGGETGRAREILERHPGDAEALWFLAECAFWEADPATAAARAAEALAALPARAYAPADAVSWASGYDCLEARSLGFAGGRSYLEDQIGAFAAFTVALATGDGDRVLAIAAKTREERLAVIHPEAHVYHFYCYRVLAATGAGVLDPATVLSKAFKALQTRSTRLEDAALKDQFLEKNRWNRELLAEARAKMLG
ncbi:MAG: hypothetical protein JNG85_10885 [Spirochaetaceae bacterium]|nr:hypothetical protein [Spirochaetaceae bacterium]